MLAALAFLLICQTAFDRTFTNGLLALERGDLPAARAELEAAASIQPGNARVSLALAQTYRKANDATAANAAAERAEQLGAEDPAILHGLALYYSSFESLEKAAGLETRYAALAPRDYEAIHRALALYIRAGQPSKAVAAARAFEGWETRAGVRNLLGKAYALDGQFDAAAAELRAAMRLSPYDETFIFDAANLFLRLEKFESAIAVLNEGRKNFNRSAQLEIALGVAYYGLRRFPEAIDQFLKTIALDPTAEQAYIFLGKMLDQAGERLPEITAQFTALEKAGPGSYLPYLLHAKALRAAAADPAETEALLNRSIALDATQWETHFELGLALEAGGDLLQAAKQLEAAVDLNPKEPVPHYRLARLYDRLGEPALASNQRELHRALTSKSEVR